MQVGRHCQPISDHFDTERLLYIHGVPESLPHN